MDLKIKDENFSMFSKDAMTSLTNHVKEYTVYLKNESERIAVSRSDPDGEAKVTQNMVESIISIHGHHVVKKPSFFFTYCLPVFEALSGGFFSAAVLKENKTVGWEIVMVTSFVAIVISLFLRHHHDTK